MQLLWGMMGQVAGLQSSVEQTVYNSRKHLHMNVAYHRLQVPQILGRMPPMMVNRRPREYPIRVL